MYCKLPLAIMQYPGKKNDENVQKTNNLFGHATCLILSKLEKNMFFDPDCIPCIINQANRAARNFTNGNEDLRLTILKEICEKVKIVDRNYTAPHFSIIMQDILEKHTAGSNIYHELKEKNLRHAQEFLPVLEELMKNSKDKLETAVKIAIMGNAIDLGANPDFDLRMEVQKLMENKINLPAYRQLRDELEKAGTILYIADNYEEALFDIFLLKRLKHKNLIFAVRSHPILNDVTLRDAVSLGIPEICNVIESGSKIAGTDLITCSNPFLNYYRNADIVIAKGQGSYETLLDSQRPLFFLFKVKCRAIAERCGYEQGDSVLYYHTAEKNI